MHFEGDVAHAADENTPQYLYKILSVEGWQKSQDCEMCVLSAFDGAFIHLATEEQLPRIVEKFWKTVSEYALLKLDLTRLVGRLIYEKNPGGDNRYYHLYEGAIPRAAVVEATLVRK